jgi:hypothetical protein
MVLILRSRPTAIEQAVSTATTADATSGTHWGSLPMRLAAAPEARKNDMPVIHYFVRV